MSFPWWNPWRPAGVQAADEAARRRVFEHEMRERAALLRRLGHDRQDVTDRLVRRVHWEGERLRLASMAGEVPRIVARVFEH
ncbi:MAG: hypothetical protein NZ898_09780 [Myxococcota bacterium]|nr:hypothetical protein [Myxococcota bacterium]